MATLNSRLARVVAGGLAFCFSSVVVPACSTGPEIGGRKVSAWLSELQNCDSSRIPGGLGRHVRDLPENDPRITPIIDGYREAIRQAERCGAAEALGSRYVLSMQLADIGPRAAQAVPDIIVAASQAPDQLLKNYIEAVATIGPSAVPHLIKLLEAPDASATVVTALLCLRNFGPSAKDAVAVLKGLVHHEAPGIRIAAVEALRGIGTAAEEAVDDLFLQAEVEQGPEIRDRIYQTIGAIAGTKFVDDLHKAKPQR